MSEKKKPEENEQPKEGVILPGDNPPAEGAQEGVILPGDNPPPPPEEGEGD